MQLIAEVTQFTQVESHKGHVVPLLYLVSGQDKQLVDRPAEQVKHVASHYKHTLVIAFK